MGVKFIVAAAILLGLPGFAFAQPAFGIAAGSNSTNASGWVGGAQAGYNWQSGSLVYGLETDIAGLGLKSTMNTTLLGDIIPPPMAYTTSSIDWYGTVRGRLGWATGPVLFYGTGGFAYGGTKLNSTLIDTSFPTTLNLQSSSTKTGWVAGAGIDYRWTRNLILNLSYQYVDLGKTSLSGITFGNTGLSQSIVARDRFQVVSVGLSWMFDPPAPAVVNRMYTKAPPLPVESPPWQGIYVGGHGGGAWGHKTDGQYNDFPGPI